MAGADVESIAVAVRAVPDRDSARAAAEALHRDAQQAGGGGAPGTAAGPNAPDVGSIQTFARELQALTSLMRTFGVEVGKLIQLVGSLPAPARAATAAPVPPAVAAAAGTALNPLATPPTVLPAPAGSGLAPPPILLPAPGGGGGGGGSGWTWQQQQSQQAMIRSLLSGVLGVAGVGLGVRAAFGELSSMASETRGLEEATFLPALASGRIEDAEAIRNQLTAGPGYLTLTDPRERAHALQRFRLEGTEASHETLAALGDLGLAGTGSTQGGYGFAGELYRDARVSPLRSLELMGSISEYGLRTSQGVGELLSEFQAMNRWMTGQTGTRAVGDREMGERASAFAYLRALPGGIGEGDGANRIAQGLSGAMQSGGMAQDIAAARYRELTGENPWDSIGAWGRFQRYTHGSAVPEKGLAAGVAWAEQIKGYKDWFGEDAGEWMAMGGGVSFEQGHEIESGTPDQQRQTFGDLIRAEEIFQLQRERAGRIATTPGGAGMQGHVRLRETKSDAEWLSYLQRLAERWKASAPYLWALGEGVGGMAMSAGGGALGGLGMWRLASRFGGGAAAARAVPSIAGGASLLAPAAGIAAGLYDTYDAATAGNYGPMIAGGAAAIPGMMLGGPAGALTGYGLGSGAYRLGEALFGADEADAAVRKPSGWERSEVAEHLALMRELTRAPWMGGGGTRESLFEMPPGAMTFEQSWPIPADAPAVGGRPFARLPRGSLGKTGVDAIDPADPRIAAAAAEDGIPLGLMLGLIRAESGFRPGATSPVGARGLMQIMPATGAMYGKGDLYDVDTNLNYGTDHLRRLFDRYGSWDTAVLAYHQGEGNVDRGTIGPKGREYLANVRRYAAEYNDDLTRLSGGESRATREARERDAIVARELGPGDDADRSFTVNLVPGPEFGGIIQPQRFETPGVMQRSGR